MKLRLALLVAPFLASTAFADYTAEIFEMGSNRQKKLFELKVTLGPVENGLRNVTATYSDTAGNVAVEEKGVVKGSDIVKVDINQKQTNETATVELKEGKAFFTLNQDGKSKTESEKVKDTFVMATNMQPFITDHWKDLMAGKTIDMRYGVWFRQETVGFSLFKISEKGEGEQKRVVLKLKPTSFIIAALVDPVEFTLNHDGSRILELKGRVSPKIKKGHSYKDLDAEMVYKY